MAIFVLVATVLVIYYELAARTRNDGEDNN
jgi:hypothetical protein